MKRSFCLLLCFLLCLFAGCEEQYVSQTRFMMDTFCSLSVPSSFGDNIGKAFSLCEKLEKQLSRTETSSEIYKINNSSGAVEVSKETADLIKRALEYSQISSGAFDVSIGAVSSLWDFREKIMPEDSAVKAALSRVSYNKISVSGNSVDANGAVLDLGAIAKGYIADCAAEYLADCGVDSAVVNFGGCVIIIGDNNGNGHKVEIKNPEGSGASASILAKNCAVVTAGTYERYLINNGVRYHHILDPKTGYSAKTNLSSATIIAPSAADADALSTICILLGKSKALEFIDSIENAEAILIETNGEISATSGLDINNGVYNVK